MSTLRIRKGRVFEEDGMRIWPGLIAVGLAVATSTPALATPDDAFSSFGSGTGPFASGDGQFIYAVGGAGGGFLLTNNTGCPANTICHQTAAANASDPYILKSTVGAFASGAVSVPGDALVLRPGQNNSVQVAWIAPTAGLYNITAQFFRLDSRAGFLGVSPFFATIQNGPQTVEAFTVLGPNSPVFNYSKQIFIDTGGYFAFDLNSGNDGYVSDSTGVRFSVTSAVPEPATWGMIILGFGLASASLRRRSTASRVSLA